MQEKQEGAGVKSYEFQYKEGSTGTWTRHGNVIETSDTSYRYTYGSLQDGRQYYIRVIVTDVAGNTGKSAKDAETGTSAPTPSANTNPFNLTTSAPTNLRTTSSLTIQANADDNEQTTLYYDLYWNGSSTVTQTKSGTKGTAVTFNAISGLNKRTSYSWRVTVRDGTGADCGKLEGSTVSAYTNCPGNDLWCSGVKYVTCSSCSGYGCVLNGYPLQVTGWDTSGILKTFANSCRITGCEATAVWQRNATIIYHSPGSTRSGIQRLYACEDHKGYLDRTAISAMSGSIYACSQCGATGGSNQQGCDHGYATQHGYCRMPVLQ